MQRKVSSAAEGAPNPQSGALGAGKGHVLLAEDDRELRDLLGWALRAWGYRVSEVQDGAELLDRLTTARAAGDDVDIVITDVRMPKVGGLEALGWLQEFGSALPAVVITGFGDRNLHAEAKRLGAWAVLDKPFDLEALGAVVAALRAEQSGGSMPKGHSG